MGKVQKKKVRSVESVAKESVNTRSVKQRKCKSISSKIIAKKKKSSRPISVINKLVKDNNLHLIDDEFENVKIVSSEITVPNIKNDSIIDITDNTTDGNKHEYYQIVSSKVTVPNIRCDDVDITDTIIEDNAHKNNLSITSKVTVPNIESDDIIDITDTIIEDSAHKNSLSITSEVTVPNILSDDIITIDITDTTMDNDKYESYKPSNDTMTSNDDDIQIISHTVRVKNKAIDFITILDNSDEENIPCQQSIKRPISFQPIKDRLGASSNSKSYISPLHNHKKMLKDGNMPRQEFLPIGAFVIDKQSIFHGSKHLNKFDHKAFTFPEQHESSSDTTSDTIPVTTPRQLRPIIIDGLNIGHAHGCGTFSVKGIELCIQYFSNRGHKDIIAFIPQHRQGPPGSESNTILNELVKKGHICYTPSRKVQNLRMTCYDDRILLNYAHGCNGVVVSNDNYRDLYDESEAFKEIIENRQVMVTFVRDKIIVPDDQYNRKSDVRSLSDILCFPA